MDTLYISVLLYIAGLLIYFISSCELTYFLGGTMVSQLIVSLMYAYSRCPNTLGMAMWYSVVPWLALLGPVILVVQAYPSLATVFSDVIGYAVVSSRANTLLSDVLQTPDSIAALVQNKGDPKLSVALAKVLANQAVIINMFTPHTFESMWDMLQPIMKTDLNISDKKQQLLALVQTKHQVGVLTWYLYTGILAISVVYYYVGSLECDGNSDSDNGDQQ
jgi:hypothetical protein